MVKSLKGRRKEEERKKEREKRLCNGLKLRNKKRDALERTSLNGYDE